MVTVQSAIVLLSSAVSFVVAIRGTVLREDPSIMASELPGCAQATREKTIGIVTCVT